MHPLIHFVIMLMLSAPVFAATTNQTDEAALAEEERIWAQHVIEAYKPIQAQHEATMRAIQQVREEAAENMRQQTAALEGKLEKLEQIIATNSQEQAERTTASVQQSRQFTLTIAGIIIAVGLVAALAIVVAIVRVVNRRTAPIQMHPVGPAGAMGELPGGGTGLTVLDPAQQSNAQLRASLENFDKRLTEVEIDARSPVPPPKR